MIANTDDHDVLSLIAETFAKTVRADSEDRIRDLGET